MADLWDNLASLVTTLLAVLAALVAVEITYRVVGRAGRRVWWLVAMSRRIWWSGSAPTTRTRCRAPGPS